MTEKNQTTPYPLRMPLKTRHLAETLAKQARWSLNEWIKVAVEEKIERTLEPKT